jgi:hypothetical protein
MKSKEAVAGQDAWLPYNRGRAKNGFIVVSKPDGTRWQRPMTAEELVAHAKAKLAAPKAHHAGEVRLTVARMADGLRTHMQHREGFDAVMEAAILSEKALSNLILWLKDWQDKAAQRAIEAKKTAVADAQAAARKAEQELRDLVNAAGKK